MTITNQDFDFSKMNARGKAKFSWNGWNIEKFVPHGGAWLSAKGVFRDGKYGYLTVHEVQPDGSWKI